MTLALFLVLGALVFPFSGTASAAGSVSSSVGMPCVSVSVCLTHGIGIAGGSAIVLLVNVQASSTPSAVAWAGGTTHGAGFTLQGSFTIPNQGVFVYSLDNNAAAGNEQFWVNFSAAQTYVVDAIDVTGVASPSLDAIGSGAKANNNGPSCSVTTTVANDLILLGVADQVNNPTVSGSGGSAVINSTSPASNVNGAALSQTDVSTGSFTIAASLSASASWVTDCIALVTSNVPSPPTSLAVTATTTTTVSLSWTNPKGTVVNNTVYQASYSGGSCGAFSTHYSTSGAVTAFTVTGLISGNSYCLKVTAWNASGESAPSNQVTVTTAHVPPAPTGLAAAPKASSSTAIQLTFSNPNAVAGTLLNNTIYYGAGSGCANLFTKVSTGGASSGSTTYVVNGLSSGTTYCFSITVWNSTGQSAQSNTATATTNAGPGAPTNLGVTGTAYTTVSLAWTQPAQTGGGIVNDTVYYGLTCGAWIKAVSTAGPASTITVTNLAPSTTYCFEVSAWSVSGQGPLSSSINDTTLTNVPGAPTGLTATPTGTTTIVLSWTNPTPSDGSLVNNTVYYGVGAGCANLFNHITTGAPKTSYTVTGLVASTTYCFAVSAWTQGGQGAQSASQTATTFTPASGAPRGLTYISASRTTITFNWTNPSLPLVNNTIYYATGATCSNFQGANAINTHGANQNWTLNGLVAATTYCVEVTAWTTGGESGKSPSLITGTQGATPPAPFNLTENSDGETWVTVEWANPAGFTLFNNTVYVNVNSCPRYTSGWALIINTHGVTHFWNITGLTPSTTYCVEVIAWDAASNFSAPLYVTTTGPSPSSGGLGGLLLDHSLTLTAIAVIAGAATMFGLLLFIVWWRRRDKDGHDHYRHSRSHGDRRPR